MPPKSKRRRARNRRSSGSTTRRGGGRGPSASRQRPALAVELAITVDDGWDKDVGRVAISGRLAPRRGGRNELAAIRRRRVAAKQVTTRCQTEDLSRRLATVAHGQRLAMLCELLAGEATHKALAKLTGLKAGPLYYHIRELRSAGLIGPKVRDLYTLTRRGRRMILGVLAVERLTR